MNRQGLITAAVVTMLTALPAVAQDSSPSEAADNKSIFAHPGWYVTPMFSYMRSDRGRLGVANGKGGVLAIGHYDGAASFEVWAQYLSAHHEAWSYTMPGPSTPNPNDDETITVFVPEGTVKFTGIGVGMLIAPYSEERILGRFFAVLGGGLNRRQNHPQQAQDDNTIFLDAGIGYVHPIELWGHHSGIRTDLRWRYDIQSRADKEIFFQEQPAPRPRYYEDLVLNIGLAFGLSKHETLPQPAPEPVRVMPVEQAADADGDRAPDDRDHCPGTPAGSTVDDTGCVPPPSPTEATVAPVTGK
jgi:hypothetical protein